MKFGVIIMLTVALLLTANSSLLLSPLPLPLPKLTLAQFTRDTQLKYVERSYSYGEKEYFSSYDYERVIASMPEIQMSVVSDPEFVKIIGSLKKLTKTNRQDQLKGILKICSPTWAENKSVSSYGQTDSGQKAEKIIGELIYSEANKMLKVKNLTLPMIQKSPWRLVFNDEFNQKYETRPSSNLWSYYSEFGKINNELQNYTDKKENTYLKDGKLVISANKEADGSYTSGQLLTMNKFSWSEGKIAIRAKLPEGRGIWPAFWLMPQNDTYGSYEKDGEIDIMEMIGSDPWTIFGTAHYSLGGNFIHSSNGTGSGKGKFSDRYHIYGFEWDKNWMRWSLDNRIYASFKSDKIFKDPSYLPFSQKFYLIINLAVGGNWPGPPDENTVFPGKLLVDYVRVYQK